MVKTEELYSSAVALAKAFDSSFMELAGQLRQLQEQDPERFRDFVKATNIGLRKAYYLISVDKTFKPLKVPKKMLVELGWTKLMTIQPHVTKQNYLDLIEYAKTHTVQQLKEYLKGGSQEDVDKNQHAVLMYFSPEDYSTLVDALLQHGASRSGRGIVDKEKAMIRLLESIKKH